jgi:glycosyltransferase involved in cell wall biosynthesis
MELVAQKLFDGLASNNASADIQPKLIRPRFVRTATRIPHINTRKALFNADRLLNRFVNYPAFLRRIRDNFDVFHIIDHSYSHLVHQLPSHRTVVACHDLDTFRCLLAPDLEPRSVAFKAMTRRILRGLQRAAVVTCDSCATRDQILAHKVVPADRLVVMPNGVDGACSPDPDRFSDQRIARLLGNPSADAVELLHVGTTIARKRIDLLLRIFAEVRKLVPSARLLRVGGEFTTAQRELARDLQIEDSVVVMPYLERSDLAAVYRRATMLLLPSEGEGFGLPVVEAMTCGTPVVASDIPALREVGGAVAEYCPVGDVASWTKTILALFEERRAQPQRWATRRDEGLRWAARFSWDAYASQSISIYRQLAASAA